MELAGRCLSCVGPSFDAWPLLFKMQPTSIRDGASLARPAGGTSINRICSLAGAQTRKPPDRYLIQCP